MTIFESAVKKLTLWYVGALFLVCLIFSVPAYVITSDRLDRGARRQEQIIQEVGPFGTAPLPTRFSTLRDQQVQQDRQQLLRALIMANLAILALGAYFSYRFAKRTLTPIEEAHQAQARFTTDASHELRTPLATMQAEIEVALRDKKFNATQAKDVLVSNLEEIARLRTLSEQLLNLTRLDSHQAQKTAVKFSKLVEGVVAQVQKQAEVTATIDKDITVQGDEQLLRQLITILTDNAIKYAHDKSPKLAITLKKYDEHIQLTVQDHGIGIKASEQPHVFDRFYRGSGATKHGTTGHGLGLAIAKQIVEAHQGTITLSSEEDTSTSFTITLATDS